MNTHNREQISYNPFGEVRERQYCTDNTTPDARLKYIGKQLDYEMNLADHGVRKYDNILGQFTSIDPKWEKYYGWTPYQYCGNNPLSFVDPSGLAKYKNDQGEVIFDDGDANDKNEYYTYASKEELETVLKSDEWDKWSKYRLNKRPSPESMEVILMQAYKSTQPSNKSEYATVEDENGKPESGQGDFGSFPISKLLNKVYERHNYAMLTFHTHMLKLQGEIIGTEAPDQPSDDGNGNGDYPVQAKLMSGNPLMKNAIIYDPNSKCYIYYNDSKVTFKIHESDFKK